MTTPVDVVKRFKALTEAEKVACMRDTDAGPHFLFEGYEISLKEVVSVE